MKKENSREFPSKYQKERNEFVIKRKRKKGKQNFEFFLQFLNPEKRKKKICNVFQFIS